MLLAKEGDGKMSLSENEGIGLDSKLSELAKEKRFGGFPGTERLLSYVDTLATSRRGQFERGAGTVRDLLTIKESSLMNMVGSEAAFRVKKWLEQNNLPSLQK